MKIPISKFLDNLQRLILSGEITTEYSHATRVTPAKIIADCSGFVAWVLMATGHKDALREIRNYKYPNHKTGPGWNRIFVRDFVEALEVAEFSNWLVLTGPEELCDADIMFSTDWPVMDDTNHVVFVRHCSPLPDGRFKLRIMDSSRKYIHFNDTKNEPGIGTGDIFIRPIPDSKMYLIDYSPDYMGLRKRLWFARVI